MNNLLQDISLQSSHMILVFFVAFLFYVINVYDNWNDLLKTYYNILLFFYIIFGIIFYLSTDVYHQDVVLGEDVKQFIRTSSLVDLTTSFEGNKDEDIYEIYIQKYARMDEYLKYQEWSNNIEEIAALLIRILWTGCMLYYFVYDPAYTIEDYIEIVISVIIEMQGP